MSRKVYMRAPVINEIPEDNCSEIIGKADKKRLKQRKSKCCNCCGKSATSDTDGSDVEAETSFCSCCKKKGSVSDRDIAEKEKNGKQESKVLEISETETARSNCCICCLSNRNRETENSSESTANVDVEKVPSRFHCCPDKTLTGRQARTKCLNCCKITLSFFFSHVGLCSLVVGYSIAGGFIFRHLEAPTELRERSNVAARRQHYVQLLWNMTAELNILHQHNWTTMANEVMTNFQREVYRATKEKGWNGQDGQDHEPQWSFPGALLYSVTVITTIGYGNLAPRTRYGRLVTIFYALIGIPLTLLCLANIGSLFGDCFRFFYKHLIRFLSWICLPAKSKISRRNRKGRSKVVFEPVDHDDDMTGSKEQKKERPVRVPLFVSILLIALYIFGGAMLFSMWEGWDYLIGSYFCFITLSTIGFGDFVPGASIDSWANEQKSVLCALYLVFGLSLIAMCFNLMQEEVRAKFRWLALKLNLIDKNKKQRTDRPHTIF